MSRAIGFHHSEETKRKIGAANKGNIKIAESSRGRRLSVEARKKVSEAQKGRPKTEETKLKISKSRTGKYKGKLNHNWKGGISFGAYCNKFDYPFKERCRNFFARICVNCGKTEVENRRRLDVHHVNFDKMTCCNDIKPLYVVLCASCHKKTNYNREYWEQHFTEIINTKYNGQCYLPKEENF